MGQEPGRVVVVGAGVTGLTCAVRLAEAGHRVDVLARDLPLETTSVVAAALWYPYKALPQDRVTAWSAAAYDAFAKLASPETGVTMMPGTEVLPVRSAEPWWAGAVPALAHTTPPQGYADAWSFVAPVIDMPVYLSWLRTRLDDLGGTVTRMSLPALPQTDDVVVNCAGMGSRLLAHDDDVRPVRGQVVLLSGVELDRWWLDSAGPTYVVPRQHTVVVGGTDDEGDWSRTPSPETATEILQRATRLVPELATATVVGHRVGLRPVRSGVRLETEGRVVHCYGQGGAGVTLSWGCADEVTELVGALMHDADVIGHTASD
jgi:D-amino-acid oxidase